MLTDHTDRTDFFARAACFSTTEMTDLTDFVEHCMLTSLFARCCDLVPYYIICANIFRHGYVTGQ